MSGRDVYARRLLLPATALVVLCTRWLANPDSAVIAREIGELTRADPPAGAPPSFCELWQEARRMAALPAHARPATVAALGELLKAARSELLAGVRQHRRARVDTGDEGAP